jgi:hypothetical protein
MLKAETEVTEKTGVDAFDIINAFEILEKHFDEAKKTATEKVQTDRGEVDTSKGHRRGEKEFNVTKDVIGAVESFFMGGPSDKDAAGNKRKYRLFVTMVLKPFIRSFDGMSHEEVFRTYKGAIDDMINFTRMHDENVSPDDAKMAMRSLKNLARNENKIQSIAQKIAKMRKSKKSKKD